MAEKTCENTMRPSGFEPLTYRLEVVASSVHRLQGFIFSRVFNRGYHMGTMFFMAVSTDGEYRVTLRRRGKRRLLSSPRFRLRVQRSESSLTWTALSPAKFRSMIPSRTFSTTPAISELVPSSKCSITETRFELVQFRVFATSSFILWFSVHG